GSPGPPESCEAVPDLLDLLPVNVQGPAGSCHMDGAQMRRVRQGFGDPAREVSHVLATILRMRGDIGELGDIARVGLDDESAAACRLHHRVIVEAGIDHQRFDIYGHLHPTVDMSLDVVIERIATPGAPPVTVRPLVATILV